jgi:hypothetical protein
MSWRQRLGVEDDLCGDNVTRSALYTHRNDGRNVRNTDTYGYGHSNADRNTYGNARSSLRPEL